MPDYTGFMPRALLGSLSLLASLAAVLLFAQAASAAAPWPAAAQTMLPPQVIKYFTPEDLARGQAYTQGRYWIFAAAVAIRLAGLLLLILTPASAALRNLAIRLAPSRPAVAVALYLALLVVGFELLTLPLGYYAGFVREHAFHLSTQTAAGWFLDRAKSALLTLVLAVPLGSLLVYLWRHYPGRWVLPAWGLGGIAIIVIVALAPIVIDPLFNTIRPLQDPVLRDRVIALAARAGLHTDRVYVSDASRRTTRENAYFTGLGATKRVVLYDTLLRDDAPDEVALVVAHELGHWKHDDIWKGIALSLLGLAISLWLAARALDWAARRELFHLGGPADVAAVPLFLLVIFALSLLALPIQNAISRSFESAADYTSLELTDNPAAFIRSEVRLARSNLADLNPPPLVVFWLYTHPPTVQRIRMAEEFAAKAPSSPKAGG